MRLRKDTEILSNDEAILIADVSDALAHPVRVMIYQHILKCNKDLETVCNKDLVEAFDYSQATVSQHVQKLSSAGLIQVEKRDKKSIYYANIGRLTEYLAATRKLSTLHG